MTATLDSGHSSTEVELIMPDEPTETDQHDDEAETDSPQEREIRHDLVQGELAGKPIYVPPVKQWRASAMHALRNGDIQTWAEITLDDDDWDIWQEVDPSLAEIEDFFESVNKGLGTSPGNSRASRRSSRSTGRR